MWHMQIFHIEMYFLFYNFIIYSVFGWVYESCLVSYKKKQWVNRGFLNGPIIPIYGAGATVLHIVFTNIHHELTRIDQPFCRGLFVFMTGMVAATILEYVTSWIMEIIFHARWWDYSHYKINLNGRICLAASLLWGALSVVMAYLIQPKVTSWIEQFPIPEFYYLGYGISVLIISDLLVTAVSALQLDKKLASMKKLRADFIEYIEATKLYETQEEFRNKVAEMSFTEVYEGFKENFEDRLNHLKERRTSMETIKERKLEIEKQLKERMARYQKHSKSKDFVQRRLLKAFPNIKVKDREKELKDYRNK